jgi:hypothetical protein
MAIPYTGLSLPLAVIHGLVTVSIPGPVQKTFSTEHYNCKTTGTEL